MIKEGRCFSNQKIGITLQPQLGGGIFAEQRAVADVAADHGERAVSGLAHDGEFAGAIQIALGREAGAQGMAGVAGGIERRRLRRRVLR